MTRDQSEFADIGLGDKSAHRRRRGRIVMFTRDQRIDRRILLQADALQSDGWSVLIIAVPGDPAQQDDPCVVRIGDSRRLRPAGSPMLEAYRALSRLFPVNSPWITVVRAIGLSLYQGGPETLALRLFAEPIAEQVADIYVAHDLPMLPVAIAAANRHGGRVVYDSHELFAEQELSVIERRLWSRLEGRLIGRCDLVMTINPSIARELEQRYGIKAVAVIQNAERSVNELNRCGLKPQTIREHLALPAGAKILLYQGGISEGRNLDMPIRAMKRVATQGIHLVYLGDGLLKERLRKIARRVGVSDRFHLIPAVPQSDLLAYTASADAGVIPYRANCLNTYYCTPNKLFELVAAMVPIISSDLPELRRLIAGNAIGLVGDTGTPDGLAGLIDALFAGSGPSRFTDALIRACEHLCWEVESKRLLNLYQTLIGQATEPRPC